MKTVVMIVINHVKPNHQQEYIDIVSPVLAAMRHEPTFINTVLHQDPLDSTRFMLYETWADHDEFFKVQMKRNYRRAYEERLPYVLRSPREINFFEPLRADFVFFAYTNVEGES